MANAPALFLSINALSLFFAGAAVITNRPRNLTVEEGQGAEFPCKARANPGNLSVSWFHKGIPISSIGGLDARSAVKKDGTLVISKVEADDQGEYSCEVTNGIGRPISAKAHLAVECKLDQDIKHLNLFDIFSSLTFQDSARVIFHPTTQYIPRGLSGVIKCHIKANPPIQFVTWTKDKRIYDPFDIAGVMAMENGSIKIDRVSEEHAGDYVCTPYNIHGNAGSSKTMNVVIKDPPTMSRRPDAKYLRPSGSKVTLPCGAMGIPRPSITWRRVL